jgi:hypothetical protein
MNSYEFKSIWSIEAPIDIVWDVIAECRNWPQWWPFLDRVDIVAPGGVDGTGLTQRFVWRGTLPYSIDITVQVTRIERPFLIEGITTGDLEGTGRWIFVSESDNSTIVEYLLNVKTTKPWMNILAHVLSLFFKWNHNRVMAAGRDGLIDYLRFAENGQTERSVRSHFPGPSRISP